MKIKNAPIKTLLLLTLSYTYSCLIASNNTILSPNNQADVINALKKNAVPEDITKSRTHFFNQTLAQDIIKSVYNDAQYASLLSMDPRPILSFLDLSSQEQLNLDTEQVLTILRLYHNKYKSCEIIDDHVIHAILEKLPQTFERHCTVNLPGREPHSLEFIKQATENIILSQLTEQFAHFQAEPENFVAHLAEMLAQKHTEQVAETTRRHTKYLKSLELAQDLKALTVRFFENLFSRAIWTLNPDECWSSFKKLGESLDKLDEFNIVTNEKQFDDLAWSLVIRFAFFIEITGASLPVEFYEQAERDLAQQTIPFLEEQEIDNGIVTKKETIANALIQGKIRSVAFHHGLVANNEQIAAQSTMPEGTIRVL